MITTIHPGISHGKVHIPPSKSMAHRAIICASLANGKSRIANISYSKDILSTIEGMRILGATIITYKNHLEIEGIQDFNQLQQSTIHCSESGSTLRFLIPIFSLCNEKIQFTGEGRLMNRPQQIYKTIFTERGLLFKQEGKFIEIANSLTSGKYELDGDVSSQFISGLLFTLPLCKGDSLVTIKEPFASRSYVELTMQMLSLFGIETKFHNANTIIIKGNQSYRPMNYTIEGDFSQLAFFAVLAALNHDLEITGVQHTSLQGDKVIIDILRQANVNIDRIPHGYHIHKSNVTGTSIDLANCPDLGPILCVLASFAKGETHIYNAERLRIKESDRILAMETELRKMGVHIKSSSGDIHIQGNSTYCGNKHYHGHNDHRIVMAMAIASTLCENSSTISDAQAIAKSYPDFFEDLTKIGINVELHEY